MGWLIAIRRCNYGACWKYADFVRNHLCASTSTAKQTQQHAKTPNATRRILRRWQIFLAYILIYERKLVQTLVSSIRCSPFRVPLCVSRVPGERLQSIHLRSLDTVAELWPLCCHADVLTTKKKTRAFYDKSKVLIELSATQFRCQMCHIYVGFINLHVQQAPNGVCNACDARTGRLHTYYIFLSTSLEHFNSRENRIDS